MKKNPQMFEGNSTIFTVTGRQIKSQKKNPKNPIAKLNIEDLKGWLEKHKVNFYYEL